MCLHLTSSLQPTARASAARGQAGEEAGKGAGPEIPGGREEETRHRQGPWGTWGSRSWLSMPVTGLRRVYREAVMVVVMGLQPAGLLSSTLSVPAPGPQHLLVLLPGPLFFKILFS